MDPAGPSLRAMALAKAGTSCAPLPGRRAPVKETHCGGLSNAHGAQWSAFPQKHTENCRLVFLQKQASTPNETNGRPALLRGQESLQPQRDQGDSQGNGCCGRDGVNASQIPSAPFSPAFKCFELLKGFEFSYLALRCKYI